jgi:hypothetical protein
VAIFEIDAAPEPPEPRRLVEALRRIEREGA